MTNIFKLNVSVNPDQSIIATTNFSLSYPWRLRVSTGGLGERVIFRLSRRGSSLETEGQDLRYPAPLPSDDSGKWLPHYCAEEAFPLTIKKHLTRLRPRNKTRIRNYRQSTKRASGKLLVFSVMLCCNADYSTCQVETVCL